MNTHTNNSPNLSVISLLTILIALGCAFAPLTFATGGNWTNNAAGNWNTAANWVPNVVPGTAAGDVVGLNTNITAARTVTLDTAATVGTLNIGDPTSSYFSYTLSGSSTLTFDNSGSAANLRQATVGGANDTLSVPITLTDNLTIFNANGLTNSGVISGSGKGITKAGTGTLTLNGSAVNTYTGDSKVTAGTLLVDFANLASPTNLIDSGSALALGGGKLQIKQRSAAATSQTFNGTTVNADSSTAIIATTNGAGGVVLDLGAITPNSSGTVDFTVPSAGSIKTTREITNGILGGWATVSNNVAVNASGGAGGWATTNGTGAIVAYTGYTPGTPSGVTNSNNYRTSAGASVSANATVNSLVISGSGGNTTIDSSRTLTLSSGGLFIGGSQRYLDGSGTIKSGLGSGELYLHCNRSDYIDYRIYPVIADGAVATKLIKDGPGVLMFYSNAKTYTGGTVVNGGTLDINVGGGTGGIRGSVTVNPGATLNLAATDAFGYTSAAVSVTNVNIVGGTVDNDAGNQGLFTTFNLTGGSMTDGADWTFGSAAYSAINSLASPVASTISGGSYIKGDVVNLPITAALGSVPNGIDLVISGVIAGDAGKGIVKSGSGTVQLSAANTFTGTNIVNGGTLYVTGSLRSSTNFLVQSNSTFKVDASNIFTADHGTAMATTRLITVDNATLLMDTSFQARFGNVTLKNGATWTCNRSLASYDALLANTSAGAATVLVTNTSGTAASTMNGATGIRIQGVQNFDVADVTGDSASDLNVSMILSTQGTQGGTAGGVNKLGAGTMTLSAANTYSNTTTINAGTLALSGSGSITNSTNIILNASSAVFDVSATTFTLGAKQTLSGLGTVLGTANMASGGTITAGTNNVGNLTLSGLTFNGTATNNVRPGAAYLIVTGVNGLTTSGAANSVRINLGAGALTAGTYTLIDYSGSIQGTGFSAFQLGATPGGLFAYTLVDNTANSSVDLLVEVAADVWTGALSSEWSTAVLSSPKNWKYSGSPADYVNGTDVLFDDTATGTTTVDLSVADVTPSAVLFNNVNSNYTLQGTAAIAGSIGLTKTGAGTVTINNTNKFVGAVSISAGTVAVNNIANKGVNSALGAGTNISLGGATLSYTGDSASSDRPVSVSSPSTLEVTSGGTTLTLGGAITGAAGLTKTGNGTLVLTNTGNTYASNTINAGTLSVDAVAQLGTSGPVTFGGGTLAFTGSSALSFGRIFTFNASGGTLQADNSAGVTLSSAVGGTGGLTKTGTGMLTLSAINTYTGGTEVNNGALRLLNGGADAAIRGSVTVNSGANLRLSTVNALGYDVTSTSVTNINVVSGSISNVTGGDQGYFTTYNLAGGSMQGGSGFWIFGSGTYGGINSLASSNASIISGDMYFKGSVANLPINTEAGTVPSEIDLEITGAINGDAGKGVVKSGAGTLKLTGACNYSGGTTVSEGVLQLAGGGATSGGTLVNSAITVASGAELQLNTDDALGYGNTQPLTNAGTLKQIYAFSETLNRPLILNGGTITSTASNVYNEAYNFFGGYIRTLAGTSNSITGIGNFGLRTSSCYFTNEAGSTLTITCPIQGWTGTGTTPLNKTGAGTLELSASNTYAGNTVISAGTLALSGSGTIGSSPLITVASGATFGAAAGASVTLGAAQTLSGDGTITGVFTNNGTITPGISIGTLTFGDAPTLVGTIVAGIDQVASPNADKIVISSGTLDFGGTLTVTNLGGTPTNGTVFDLFDGTLTSSFTTVNLPAGGTTHWLTSDLNVGGTISFTNNTPVCNDDLYGRVSGLTFKVKKSDVLTNDTDLDLDTISMISVAGTTTNGGTLSNDATYIYVPANTVDDAFTYTVNDGFGGTNTGTVLISIVTGGTVQGLTVNPGGTTTTTFAGIPGYPYLAERATNVAFTGTLRTWTTNAPAGGLFQVEDDFSDIGAPPYPSEAYYRMRYNP